MNTKEFLKSIPPVFYVILGIFFFYVLIMITKAGFATGQFIHSLVN